MQWPIPALPDCKFKDPQNTPLEKVINRGTFTPLGAPTICLSNQTGLSQVLPRDFPGKPIPFYTLEETTKFWTFLLLLEGIISHFLVSTLQIYALVSGSQPVQPALLEAELEQRPRVNRRGAQSRGRLPAGPKHLSHGVGAQPGFLPWNQQPSKVSMITL